MQSSSTPVRLAAWLCWSLATWLALVLFIDLTFGRRFGNGGGMPCLRHVGPVSFAIYWHQVLLLMLAAALLCHIPLRALLRRIGWSGRRAHALQGAATAFLSAAILALPVAASICSGTSWRKLNDVLGTIIDLRKGCGLFVIYGQMDSICRVPPRWQEIAAKAELPPLLSADDITLAIAAAASVVIAGAMIGAVTGLSTGALFLGRSRS